MQMQTIRVPQLAFYGDTDLELALPASWQVEMRPMPGAEAPPLRDEEIRAVLGDSIGTPPLRELARGRREAVIIFDDIARPTPVDRLWPFVVEELHAAGLGDDQIRMIVALGTHAAHSREELRRKVGEEALRRFPVYNHNCYQHCTYVGTTARGTPVEVNDEVLACDLRIGIGSVLPHPAMGFGGGPKIILPGVVSLKTIDAHHTALRQRLIKEGHGATIHAGFAEGPLWQDIADAAQLADLEFVVNAILNERRGVADMVAGHPVEAWRRGVELARRAYATLPAADADVVITNGYGKGNEAMIAAYAAHLEHGAPPQSRDVVAISIAPQGVVVHYLMGDFGPATWHDRTRRQRTLPPGIRSMILYNPYPEMSNRTFFQAEPEPLLLSDWEEVLDHLVAAHPDGARVVVYPDLTVQYLDPEAQAVAMK